MQHNKAYIKAALGAVLAGAVALGAASHATQLNYAVGFPTGAAPESAREYAKAVKTLSDGSLSVRVFDLSLLNLAEMSEGVNKGITDVGYVLTPYFPAEYPHINMASEVSMLLALNDNPHGKEGMAYGGAMAEFVLLNCPECHADFAKQGQVYTSGGASGPYGLLCNKPMRTRDDLRGARLRSGGAAWARWATHFEASAVSMSGNEIYEALSQGVVDCAIISATELSGLNLKDATTHITMNVPGGVFAGNSMASVNAGVWQKLDEAQRKAMMRAGAVMGAETSYRYDEYARRDLDAAVKKGVQVHTADDALVQASREFIRNDVRNVAQIYTEKHGVKRADELLATLDTLVQKWSGLISDVDNAQELAELYWNEVYSKVDVSTHGMAASR
nr:C4-dicarboxylate TRAP transporter substrate-binding protein [Pseudomonas sp.]